MDNPYDHIQEEILATEEVTDGHKHDKSHSNDLNTELRDAYKAFSATPWGAKLGGILGSVKKQGEQYYEGARQELSAVGTEATKGLSDLLDHTRHLSLGQTNAEQVNTSTESVAGSSTGSSNAGRATESLSADIVKEAETILTRFRVEATERLKQVQKAEDAADEALLKFGTNIRNFLRDAVTIAPPSGEEQGGANNVLFESKDAEGKRVVHATRFDAQLHVIHTTATSFTQDPLSDAYSEWRRAFNVERKTDAIAADLDKFDELRRAMEKLVPEKVDYLNFWTRYYFLRHVIETEEQKRRELLQGTQTEQEEVGWGDDDEEEDDKASTASTAISKSQTVSATVGTEAEPSEVPVAGKEVVGPELLKANEPRRSNEQSVADSDASYDVVSGTTSRTPGSPKEDVEKKRSSTVAEQSDEEDWE